MIGAKTLATVVLLVLGVAGAVALGVLAPERIAARGGDTLFLVGCFGVVVGTSMFRFWRLGTPSAHYFRWSGPESWDRSEGHFLGTERRRITVGVNRDGAFELPPRVLHAAAIALALLVALACIDARALALIGRVRASSGVASSYCPDPDARPAPTVDVNAPGCELIRRAYALGYAKSLGECAPKQREADAARAPCTRRQRDEPLVHYGWRLLDGFWSRLRQRTQAAYLRTMGRDFGERVGRLGTLRAAEQKVLASAPHAAHHIWTNLPDPGDGAFAEHTCGDRYRQLAHRPTPREGATRASQVFEHVMAQLLYESRYEPSAGSCRELHLHWGAPADACRRLAAAPQAFLAQSGALPSVSAVLDRLRVERELAQPGAPPPPSAAAVVTLQCYVEGAETGRTRTPIVVAGQPLAVTELRVRPAADPSSLDRYGAVAQLLVDGFHYGRLLSEAGLGEGAADGLARSLDGDDFLLTRLYGLDGVDIYLDPGWIVTRPDLLEVYPYQRHLKNYVQTFRRQYRRERGRL